MSDLPPRPANAVFKIRLNGRILSIGFNNLQEAEQAARAHLTPGQQVEIIDGVTGRPVKRL
jgi:hypothetical protein